MSISKDKELAKNKLRISRTVECASPGKMLIKLEPNDRLHYTPKLLERIKSPQKHPEYNT